MTGLAAPAVSPKTSTSRHPSVPGGDGITVYGSDGPVVIIRRCVVDLGSWPLERLDEGLSGVDGARAVVREHQGPRMPKKEALALMAELEGRLL